MRRVLLAGGLLLAAGAVLAATPKATPELLKQGKASFTTNCAVCHGEQGDGSGPAAVALNPKPRNFGTEKFKNGDTAEAIFATLEKGLPNTTMVAFAHLSEQERWALAFHVLELKKTGAKKK